MTRETLRELTVHLADMKYNEWCAVRTAVENEFYNQAQIAELDSHSLRRALEAECAAFLE